MSKVENDDLKMGDWVMINQMGNKYCGYITEIGRMHYGVTFKKGDKYVISLKDKYSVRPMFVDLTIEELRSLTDLALSTKDEEWFNSINNEIKKLEEL